MRGIGAVGGMALAGAYLFDDDAVPTVKRNITNPEAEYLHFLHAKNSAASQLKKIMKTASKDLGKEDVEILDYQLLLLDDDDFLEKIRKKISDDAVNCEYALESVANQYIEIFANMDNDYLRERTSDIADLVKRLMCILSGKEPRILSGIRHDIILAASDLTPSQAAGINKEKVKGILLERGGMSSHSVIIARSIGIPCIIGVANLLRELRHGETLLINGNTGEIIASPNEDEVASYNAYSNRILEEKRGLERFKNCKSVTSDGTEIKVYANITTPKEVEVLLANGGEGVGLFRTEFLYMAGNNPPSEEFQYRVYSEAARALGDRPIIIRTLDAGFDKKVPYLGIPPEENPGLGFRAIRFCLENPEIFKSQVSAILRAGVHGKVLIMLPMIAAAIELRKARKLISETAGELKAKGVPFCEDMRVGIMMETPSAAIMADKFAEEADFFSIGTNDLIQYLFAADRMNPRVAYLNSCYHPALLRTVYHICKCAARVACQQLQDRRNTGRYHRFVCIFHHQFNQHPPKWRYDGDCLGCKDI